MSVKRTLALTLLSALAGAAMAVAGPITSASATQFISNGGFEDSSYTDSTPFSGPSVPAKDWSSNGNWVMFCSGSGIRCDDPHTNGSLYPTVPLSPQGGNFIGMDGTSGYDGSLSQTISGLKTGEQLTLSFYMATAQQCCNALVTSDQVIATLGGETFTTPRISTPAGGSTPWTLYSTTFTYDGTGNILTFLNSGTGEPPFALIDGVSLTTAAPGPVPGSGLLGLAVLALAGLYSRMRRA
jgi:hypothetical protein